MAGKIEHLCCCDRDEDRHEYAWDPRQPALEHQDQPETDQTDRDSGADRLSRSQPVHERARLVDQAVGVSGEAEEFRQLSDQDRQCQTVHVADLRWL